MSRDGDARGLKAAAKEAQDGRSWERLLRFCLPGHAVRRRQGLADIRRREGSLFALDKRISKAVTLMIKEFQCALHLSSKSASSCIYSLVERKHSWRSFDGTAWSHAHMLSQCCVPMHVYLSILHQMAHMRP